MKFIKKMDEMELVISLKAIKWAWAYTVLFLFIWSIVDCYRSGSFSDSVAFFLLITQNVILIGIQIFLKWKLGRDEE